MPELRARFLEMQASWISSTEVQDSELAAGLARRHVADDRQLRVVVAALSAAVTIAIDEWQRNGGTSDLLGLFDQTVDALVAGIDELQPRRPSKHG